MDSLVHASLFLRRFVRRGYGLGVAAGLATYVVLGGATAPASPLSIAMLALWVLLLGSRLARKLRQTGDAPLLVDVEVGALLAVGLDAALLRFDGGLNGHFAPSVYVLVAFVAAFGRPVAGIDGHLGAPP